LAFAIAAFAVLAVAMGITRLAPTLSKRKREKGAQL